MWRIFIHSSCYLAALLLICISIPTSHAQEAVREVFTAGSSASNLLVYDSLDDLGHVNIVREGVVTAMDSFDTLFDDPVTIPELDILVYIESFLGDETSRGSESLAQSHYDSVGDPDFIDVVGDHVFIGSDLCYLRVDDFASDSSALQFEIAHEVARCFLANSFTNLDTDYGNDNQWLVESLSEWLATTAYPIDAGAILSKRLGFNQLLDVVRTSDTFIGNNRYDYTAVYFWMYLATLEGDAETLPATPDSILNLLRNYRDISYSADFFQSYLNTEIENLSDQFGNFGVSMAMDLLAGQPFSDDLFDTPIPTDIPVTDTVSMDTNFSLRFKQFSTFIDVPAIEVSVSGLAEGSSLRVYVSGNEVRYQRVTPGAPVILCKEADEILLSSVVSRAYEEGATTDISFEIVYKPLEEYEECEEPDPDLSTEAERGDGTSCLVGEFELVDLPSEAFSNIFGDLSGASDISVGSMNLTIDEALNVTHTAEDFSVNMDMSGMQMLVNINIAVSGNLNLMTEDGITFAVESFSYVFESITATATIDDQTMDLSDLASDMVAEFGNAVFLPPVQLVCQDFGLDYHVSLNGIESVWGYHKIDTASE